MIEYVELRLHSGGTVKLLPDYSTCDFDTKYNDIGVLEFTYPAVWAKNLGITDQSMISVVVGLQGQNNPYEVDRYYIENIDDEKVVDGVRMATFAARSWLSGLEDAAVYPSNWPATAPTGHEFVDQTVGTIFRTLILRAKNRGGLQQFNETTFTGTQDSLGQTWDHLHTQNYATGTNYYQVLQEFMDRGFVDAWVDASGNLRIVNGGDRGSHIPVSTVELRPAKNVTEMTTTSQSGESASTVLIEGEEGTAVERHDAAMQTTLGRRRERYVQQGGIEDAGVLTLLGDAELSVYGRIPVEETVGLGSTINPFTDFTVGDWVWVRYESDQAPVERRVRQLAVGINENREISLGVTLNSILYENDVALARRVEAYAGSGGSYGSVPNTSYDNTTPNPPASVNVTSGTYVTQGKMQAAISVNWAAPTTNVGGTALTDLAGYQMQWRYDGDPVDQWSPIYPSDDTVVGYSPVTPGAPIDVRVRALDESGHASDWVVNTTHVVALDTVAPAKPSKLTVAQKVGAIGIRWDGLSAAATPMSNDFALLEIHGSQTAGFTPTQGNLATLKGTMVGASLLTIPDLPPGQTWYYRAIAVDSTGNASPASDVSDALVVAKIVSTELSDSINDAIDDAVALVGRVSQNESDIIALQSADGASQVFYGPTQPANPTTPTATWFKLDDTLANGGNVIDVLVWNSGSSSWVSTPMEHQTIASLDMGKATVGLLNAARIDVESLNATGQITVGPSQINATLGGGNLYPNSSFEISPITGVQPIWQTSYGKSTLDSKFGGSSLLITGGGTNGAPGVETRGYLDGQQTFLGQIDFVVSAWVKVLPGDLGRTINVVARGRGTDNVNHYYGTTRNFTPTGDWQRVVATGSYNTGTTPSIPGIDIRLSGSFALAEGFFVDGVQIELGNVPTSYAPMAMTTSIIEYAVNSSETVAPTTGWSTTQPARTPGTFVWFRTTVTYGGGSTNTTSPALLTGNTGAPGADAPAVYLTATSQALISPSGGGATAPTTSTVTGSAVNTTITAWTYSVNSAAFSATVPAGVSRSGNTVTITGSTMTANTIAVRMADANGVADTLTVAKVSNGATGTNGSDGITVLLSNESHTFAGTTSAAVAGSTTSQVLAFTGTTQSAATIGTITGQVTGLTTTIQNNGTTTAQFTVTVTTSLTAQAGELTVPVTVGGTSFTKKFSWSVNRTGSTGSTGASVTSITPYYAQVATGAAAPAKPTASTPPAPWQLTEPAYAWNTELYRTDKVLFSTASFAYTDVVKVSSYTGATALRTLWGLPSDTTYINGGMLANHTVLSQHVLVADYTNYWPDPTAELGGFQGSTAGTSWSYVSGITPTSKGTATAYKAVRSAAGSSSYCYPFGTIAVSNRQIVVPGEEYHFESAIRRNGGTTPTTGYVRGGMWFYDANLNFISSTSASQISTAFTNLTWYEADVFSVDAVVPDNARYMWILPMYFDSATDGGNWEVTDVSVARRLNGELIVDGSVTAKQLKADEGWVGYMEVDRLVGGNLEASVILSTGSIEARGAGIVGMSGSAGFYVMGAIPPGGNESNRPPLIKFPVNGDPNIIAGQLTASTGLFTGGATFRGESGIETGAKMILHGEIRAPKNVPVVTNSWDNVEFESWLIGRNSSASGSYAFNGTQVITVHSQPYFGDQYDFVYVAWNATTGIAVGEVHDYSTPYNNYDFKNFVYNPVRNCYHELWGHNGNNNYRIRTLDASFNVIHNSTVFDLSPYSPNRVPILGIDHSNGDLLMGSSSNMAGLSVFGWATGSTGVVGQIGVGIGGSSYSTTLASADNARYQYLAAGNFDFGVKRIVAKPGTQAMFQVWNYGSTGTTSARVSANDWPAADTVDSAWWDGVNFRHINMGSNLRPKQWKYEGGETMSTSSSSIWIGYSFYDDVGTPHETALTYTRVPFANIARSRANVGLDQYPTVPGVDSPTKSRVYMSKNTSTTTPGTFYLRATTSLQSINIWPGANGTVYGSVAAFTASAPAEIQSADNGSYWKGDNTAKFLRLSLESTTDASTSAGNLPPLRTGIPTGKHIRYGTEEIIAMNNDSTVGELWLNRGGSTVAAGGAGTFKIGSTGTPSKQVQHGSGGVMTNGSGLGTFTFPESVSSSDYTFIAMSRGNAQQRVFTVDTKNNNSVVLRVENASGSTVNDSATNQTFDWIMLRRS